MGYITNYQFSQSSLGTSLGVFEFIGVGCSNVSTNDMEHQTLSYYFEIKIKDNLSTIVTMGFDHKNFKNYIVVRWESNMVHLWLS